MFHFFHLQLLRKRLSRCGWERDKSIFVEKKRTIFMSHGLLSTIVSLYTTMHTPYVHQNCTLKCVVKIVKIIEEMKHFRNNKEIVENC